MTERTCPRCNTEQAQPEASVCASCGQALDSVEPLSRELKSALYSEITRRAREEAWLAHVPNNRFVERQHRALRFALGLVAATAIVLIPAAVITTRAANLRFAHGDNGDALLGALLMGAAGLCLLLSGGAGYVAYRISRSFLAYRRAPLERCPALIVTKRRMALDKAGRQENAFVTLEFVNGEQREYRADKAAYELAAERRAGLVYLRANHLLDLKLLPA